MIPRFNRGVWKYSEQYIRDTYRNHLVYKGCDYSYEDYIVSNLGNKLYIPIGCYYIVFDIYELPYISKIITGNILDYGYYLNKDDPVKENKLPYWVSCHKTKKGLQMFTYTIPGSYILTQNDYGNADSIIVEIWKSM
jgi:hypothetical protein